MNRQEQEIPAIPERPEGARGTGTTPWLQLARKQSQSLARSREDLVVPFRWDALEKPQRVRAWWPRISWAVIMLLVLGGATGTWAFVHHLRSRTVKQPVTSPLPEEMQPAVEQVEPVRKHRRHRTSLVEKVDKIAEHVQERKVKHAKKARPAAVTVDNGALTPREVIIVPSKVSGDDHVIVVSPPAKLGPLWTPETYKRRGVK